MKTFRILVGCVAACLVAMPLFGCGADETKADPKILESMNNQRAAQPAGQTPQQPPTGK